MSIKILMKDRYVDKLETVSLSAFISKDNQSASYEAGQLERIQLQVDSLEKFIECMLATMPEEAVYKTLRSFTYHSVHAFKIEK